MTAGRSKAEPRDDHDAAWTVTLHRDTASLDALAEEWDSLLDRCTAATPFQCHAWLSSWWQAYGKPGRLRVLTVRRDGRLVGLAPLMLRRRLLPVLGPIGVGVSDFHDVLLDDEHADQAAAVLACGLARDLRLNRPWVALDLRELRADAAAFRVADRWNGATRRLSDSLCQHLPGVPMDDIVARLPGRTAQRTRVKLRKLAAAGVKVDEVPAGEVPQAVGELLALHDLQWRGRGATPEHLRERFAGHLSRSAARMVAADRAVVRRYWLDGGLLGCELLLQGPDLAALYFYGVHPEARERLDVAGMLLQENLTHCAATGRTELSLLRGDEPYKQRWRPDQARNRRLLLGGGPAVALHGSRIRLRTAVARRLRECAPWLASVRSRLRTLRERG